MAFGCVVRGAPKDRILTSSLKLVLLLFRGSQGGVPAVCFEQYNRQTELGRYATCLWMGLACLLSVRYVA